MGGSVARITLSPRYLRDYGLSTGCDADYSLPRAVSRPDVKGALDNPAIRVLMITAFDRASFGPDCDRSSYLNPASYTPQTTGAMLQEYSNLTLHLSETYARTGKRFILSNWESDNAVYCGSAYSFVSNPDFRQDCLSHFALYSGGASSPAEAFEALRIWYQVRARGIAHGRKRAEAAGLRIQTVFLAPEFNTVYSLHDHGYESMLYDVIPHLTWDYISYSSYESLYNGVASGTGRGVQLSADLDLVASVAGSNSIIIGEAGFSADQVEMTRDTIAQALNWGVAYLMQWNLYQNATSRGFELLDPNGNPTALGVRFEGWFAMVSIRKISRATF
jgi:hypothetical protein